MPELTDDQLESLMERAAERGAQKALHNLGLHDDQAPQDIAEIRSLLTAWRDAKSSALKAAAGWLTAAFLTYLTFRTGIKFWDGQ